MKLANVSKWEIAGVSAYPIVTALFALNIPAKLGLTSEAFLEVLAGLLTLAAVVRAIVDSRKVVAGSGTPEVLK